MPDKAQKSKKKVLAIPTTEASQHSEKSTRQFILWVTVIIVVVVLCGGAILYWLIGTFVNQSNKNKSQDITIGLLREKKTHVDALKPNYEKITAKGPSGRSDADLILSALPTDQGYSPLIAMIEKMGAESGVKVTTISKSSDGGKTVSAGPLSYQVTVVMDGEFSAILEFLRKTEKSARVLDFTSMSIAGSTKSGKVSSTLTFKAYYQAPVDISPTTKEL